MLERHCSFPILFTAAAAFLTIVPATAQNLTPIQDAITAGVMATPDPVVQSTAPINVVPFEFDPFGTNLVSASWLTGIGCPTNATADSGPPTNTSTPVTDPACPTSDPQDGRNQGLFLVKTGPTTNYAAAGAKLVGPGAKSIVLTELGYDLRKSTSAITPNGSHCGAGAPRFNILTSDGITHFIGCNSPMASMTGSSDSWIRLRWMAPGTVAFPPFDPTATVSSLSIIFDEGTDTGPDFFGAAILDNIDVNGTLVGSGPTGGK